MPESPDFHLDQFMHYIRQGEVHLAEGVARAQEEELSVHNPAAAEDGADEDLLVTIRRECRRKPGAFLCYRRQSSDEHFRGLKKVQPFAEDRALFRNFASLPYDPGAIARFADRHGMLDGLISLAEPSDTDGEPVALWYWAIWQMRMAIKIAEAEKTGDWSPIQERVGETGPVYLMPESPPPGFGWDEDQTVSGHIESRRDAALAYLQMMVEEILKSGVSTTLYPDGTGGFGFSLHPKTMLAGLWLQFVQATAIGAVYQQCGYCAGWFMVDGGRADRAFCSAKCRTAAWRQRRH